ncbi:S-adenosyl-methyltransferase [Polaribacter pectinis]|uniref:S-adenosyl-methyltransferase n=1 Tax=Polaribacter pectinis TaxID=2738844 RepID=A0A7G9L6Z3_9FLAO|nr:FtsL-like putative cell division protein [Polaribacter pectinis]QNM84392.1 S-adenosyl-methyltransferase [Polaribacter pectinis]
MSKVKKGIYDFLRGSFLTDESAFKNWRVIIFVVLLLLIMISSAHNADKKVIKISELNKKKRELRAESLDTETILTRMEMESSIREKAKKRGLKPSETPPKKIKVTYKKE